MILAFCVDDQGGLAFNHRRQSRDRALVADLLAVARARPVFCLPYSAGLFDPGTVTVTDDGAGHLVATVTYDGAVAPVFKNTYTPPTTPPTEPPTNPPSKSPVPKEEKPGLPYTGDTSLSPMALGGIAGGAVVLIAAGVILRRRNR